MAVAVNTRIDTAVPDQQVLLLQRITLGWMLLECGIALFSAAQAHSVSLLAFGSDSIVELISASVVLLQFSRGSRISEAQAARACGTLLYILAAVVTALAAGALFLRVPSESSVPGLLITAGALLLMPLLARLKFRAATRTGNKALRADATQSAMCAYLAAMTLLALLLHRVFSVQWIDPAAALVAVPLLLVEARRARRGQTCSCC